MIFVTHRFASGKPSFSDQQPAINCIHWALCGSLGALLGSLGALWGAIGAILGTFWGYFLGSFFDVFWDPFLGHFWAHLGAPFWDQIGPRQRQDEPKRVIESLEDQKAACKQMLKTEGF